MSNAVSNQLTDDVRCESVRVLASLPAHVCPQWRFNVFSLMLVCLLLYAVRVEVRVRVGVRLRLIRVRVKDKTQCCLLLYSEQ